MFAMRPFLCCLGFLLLESPAAAGLFDDMRSQPMGLGAHGGGQGPAVTPGWLRMIDVQREIERARADAAANPPANGDAPASIVEDRWSDFLPLWGKELREQGYDIPLPFGASIMGMWMDQDVRQSNFKISFDRNDPPIDLGVIHLSAAVDQDFAVGARFDAFIMPFLDI